MDEMVAAGKDDDIGKDGHIKGMIRLVVDRIPCRDDRIEPMQTCCMQRTKLVGQHVEQGRKTR